MPFHAILIALFGWPGTWGTGGNMVAWAICGGITFGWLRSVERSKKVIAGLRHQELLDQAELHHEALKEHISNERDQA